MPRQSNPVLRLLIWIVALGAMLFVGFRTLTYDKVSVSQSVELVRLLNEAVLLDTVQATGKLSNSGLCSSGALEADDWAALYGECNLFFPASQGKHCDFYWLGRSCLVIGIVSYAFEDDRLRDRADAYLASRCGSGSNDWFCSYSIVFAIFPDDYGVELPRPAAIDVFVYDRSTGFSSN